MKFVHSRALLKLHLHNIIIFIILSLSSFDVHLCVTREIGYLILLNCDNGYISMHSSNKICILYLIIHYLKQLFDFLNYF